MSDSTLPRNLHRETYRGVEFGINETRSGTIGFIREMQPQWGSFCRYCTDEEATAPTPEGMRRAIDRMLARAPVYTGDLRDRSYS